MFKTGTFNEPIARLPVTQKIMDELQQLRSLLDIALAMFLGGIIGYEREKKDKPIGLRTNMLIAGASALLLIIGRFIAQSMKDSLPPETLGIDPTRIIHAIIVGVSFIGAGTILKSNKEESVKYLTTAATILISAGTGMSVALHLYILAAGATLLGLLVNTVFSKMEEKNTDN